MKSIHSSPKRKLNRYPDLSCTFFFLFESNCFLNSYCQRFLLKDCDFEERGGSPLKYLVKRNPHSYGDMKLYLHCQVWCPSPSPLPASWEGVADANCGHTHITD